MVLGFGLCTCHCSETPGKDVEIVAAHWPEPGVLFREVEPEPSPLAATSAAEPAAEPSPEAAERSREAAEPSPKATEPSRKAVDVEEEGSTDEPADQVASYAEDTMQARFTRLSQHLSGFELESHPDHRRSSIVGLDLDGYAERHATLFDNLRTMESDKGWVFRTRQDGIDVFTRTLPGRPVATFKGSILLHTKGKGIYHILQWLLNSDCRPQWDDMCSEGRVVETCAPFYAVSHFRFKSPVRFVSNRDTLLVARWVLEPDGSILLVVNSTTHPAVPEEHGFVRSNIIEGGYIIRPTPDPNVFRMVFGATVDPMGWLPSWLVDMAAWKQALTLAKFRDYIADR